MDHSHRSGKGSQVAEPDANAIDNRKTPAPQEDQPLGSPNAPLIPHGKLASDKDERSIDERLAQYLPKPDVPVDHFTGKKACHRLFVPITVPEPDPVRPNAVNLKGVVVNVTCLGVKCGLWNEERLECFDVTKSRADDRTAATLKSLEGYLRLAQEK